jgi:bacillolysin
MFLLTIIIYFINNQRISVFCHVLSRKTQNDTLFLKSILNAKNEDGFRIISEITNKAGGTHKKFQQYYKGIKVEDAEYLTHSKNGIIETINGDFERVNITSVTPAINEQRALSNALKFVNARKYKWEDMAYERFIKERTNNPDATYYPKGELVIAKDYLNGSNNFKLAWKFTISSSIPENEQWIFIDAVSGEIIGNTPLILLDGNTPGIAQTRYNNQNVGITCYSYSGGYKLYETRNTTPGHTATIHTWNSLSQPALTSPPVIEFSNSNTNWIAGSWPAIGQNQVALDAHWGEEMILDYWSILRKRNSLNNSGLGLLGYVHYYDPNRTDIWPNNAAWDGNNHVMLYGDGDGITFNPLTALDIVAHEMGHGINQYTANLHSANKNQECDALNEGFSDIWGATIEHWAAPTKQTWLMGEEVFVPFTYNCIRDLQNPHDAQAAETPHPDTYHGTYWNYNGEPHYNSTVLSHWFYLLSQGGTGWNNGLTSHAPANNGYNWTVVPIGINDAARLAYITEAHYLNSSANYSVLRQQTITAAIDSFGVNSCQVISATNAWYAVGVGSKFQYSTVTVSGTPLVCSTGTYTVSNLPTGCIVSSWTSSSNLNFSSANGNTAIFTIGSNPNCSGWVQPIIYSTTCGTYTPGPKYIVWVGTPSFTSINGPQSTPNYHEASFYIDQNYLQAVTSYNWNLNPLNGNTLFPYGPSLVIAFTIQDTISC